MCEFEFISSYPCKKVIPMTFIFKFCDMTFPNTTSWRRYAQNFSTLEHHNWVLWEIMHSILRRIKLVCSPFWNNLGLWIFRDIIISPQYFLKVRLQLHFLIKDSTIHRILLLEFPYLIVRCLVCWQQMLPHLTCLSMWALVSRATSLSLFLIFGLLCWSFLSAPR